MLAPDIAAQQIVDALRPLPSERVALRDAVGRVLAEPVASPIDIPAWDNSAMDGYAARAADLAGDPPHELPIGQEIAAGAFPQRPIGPGECARVFTGAPVPDGADTVIRQEDATPLPDGRVRIEALRDVGRNVRRRGEDVVAGRTVLESGAEIQAAAAGMLAAVAHFEVLAHRRPVVAVLASGDEIADADERDAILAGRKIASSNTYALRALVAQAGGVVLDLGIARDDPDDLRARFERAQPADLIVTTAGVSVGEHDYLHAVLEDLDLDRRFWRIRMRPGAPLAFGFVGALEHTPWIGLPGNPVSTMVTFELFARPAIRRLLGHRAPFRRVTRVTVGERIVLGPRLRHFLRVRLEPREDGPVAYLTGPQGSGILTSMLRADALVVVPEDRPEIEPGETLPALVLSDEAYVERCPW